MWNCRDHAFGHDHLHDRSLVLIPLVVLLKSWVDPEAFAALVRHHRKPVFHRVPFNGALDADYVVVNVVDWVVCFFCFVARNLIGVVG